MNEALKAAVRFHPRLPRRRHKPGTAPGTLIGMEGAPPPVIHVISYGPEEIEEKTIDDPAAAEAALEKYPVTWINIDGMCSPELLKDFGARFNLHPLSLEDVMNVGQRAKTEVYADYTFVVAPMASPGGGRFEIEQVSLFLGKNFVLTFQEKPNGDCLNPVRERIRHGSGPRIRFLRADYLAYAIIDAIVDGYFPLLEDYDDRLIALEDEVVTNPDTDLIARVHEIKRDFQHLRHSLWPMREMINNLTGHSPLVAEGTRIYLRDCYDHTVQLMDILEIYRERGAGLIEVYLSSLSNQMNQVMQVLTIIATIFIPLSFIASVYGMNFNTDHPANMPELNWALGYPFALSLMGGTAALLLFYFWRRGWLGGRKRKKDRQAAP